MLINKSKVMEEGKESKRSIKGEWAHLCTYGNLKYTISDWNNNRTPFLNGGDGTKIPLANTLKVWAGLQKTGAGDSS